MESAATFNNVFYKTGKTVILSDITLSINKGDVTGILGLNGAGKTTLLSLINGLRTQTSGTITVLGGQNPAKNPNLRRRIGVVLQETALYEELTTFENLQFAAALYNMRKPLARIIEVLELLKLTDRSDQMVRTLSGGLKRRIVIARALLHDPELLIIDEPTLGVDVEARHDIWMHLRLLKSQGRTVVVSTNYLDEAQALCNSVAVLKEGRLLTVETPDVLLNRSGFCIDIECDENSTKEIKETIGDQTGIFRVDEIPGGLSIFAKGKVTPENIMKQIMQKTQVGGFRVRAPDLAEVFKTL